MMSSIQTRIDGNMVEETIIDGKICYIYSPREHEIAETNKEIVSTTRDIIKMEGGDYSVQVH